MKTFLNCWVSVVLQQVRLFGDWLDSQWFRGLVARLGGSGTLK